MKFFFRVDSSLQIGVGHVMRCLTLADALRSEGHNCNFICRDLPGNSIIKINECGFLVSVLPLEVWEKNNDSTRVNESGDYAEWLGAPYEVDAVQTSNVIKDGADWLIVDHYGIDIQWEKILQPLCKNIMVVDDLGESSHACDLLLNQNLGRNSSEYDKLVPNSCRVLSGASYALLKPEFSMLREYSLERRKFGTVSQILISMGGIDLTNMTSQVLGALRESLLPLDVSIVVVMGFNAPWLKSVVTLAKKMQHRTEVLVNVRNMAELMAVSDLAIGAAGSTSWERCCLGLPTLLVVLAKNQRSSANSLQKNHAAIIIPLDDNFKKNIELNVLELHGKRRLLEYMTKQASRVCDGNGCRRVLQEIL